MKIMIELDECEEMEIAQAISKKTAEVADAAIANYFSKITVEEFIRILRRSLRTSCDAFFQQYMQYYIEKRAPKIFRKIEDDLRGDALGEEETK
ncbi:MAG: hypothetical protein WC683_10600 [bacterium]